MLVAECGKQRAGMQHAKVQIRRKAGCCVQIRSVASDAIVGQALLSEVPPRSLRRFFAGGREHHARRQLGFTRNGFTRRRDPVDALRVTRRWLRPAVVPPGPEEWGEHLVRLPCCCEQAWRADGVRGSGRHQGDRAESVCYPQVACRPIGSKIGAHVDTGRPDSRRNHWHDLFRTTADDDKSRAQSPEALIHVTQRPKQEGSPRRARRAHQRRIEYEERKNRALLCRLGQRRVIVEAQITPEPQDRRGTRHRLLRTANSWQALDVTPPRRSARPARTPVRMGYVSRHSGTSAARCRESSGPDSN